MAYFLRQFRHCPLFRLFAAGLCGVAYLLSGIGAIPQILALAAEVEGSHAVAVSYSAGEVKVVLHHESASLHRHGAASRLICLLSVRSATQADHVACFNCGSAYENTKKVADLKPSPALTVGYEPVAPEIAIECLPSSEFSCPGVPLECFLAHLRSTVLVI